MSRPRIASHHGKELAPSIRATLRANIVTRGDRRRGEVPELSHEKFSDECRHKHHRLMQKIIAQIANKKRTGLRRPEFREETMKKFTASLLTTQITF